MTNTYSQATNNQNQASEQPILEFSEVAFSHAGVAEPALSGVSFAIHSGEFVALMGENGSGKSTVALLADALCLPSSGAVFAHGQNTAEVDAFTARAHTALVLQNPDDQLVCTFVADDVAFGPQNAGLPEAEIDARVCAALENVGMQDFAHHKTFELSGGQKQKVALAGAIAMQPDLLILDEAMSMLDAQGAQEIMDTVLQLHQNGTAILMITHNPAEALQADRVIYLDAGRVKFDCPALELKTKAPELFEPIKLKESACTANPFANNNSEGPSGAINTPTPAIQFSNVSFIYQKANTAQDRDTHATLRDVNLTVNQGDFIAVVGHTGSGKSTLLRLMCGLLQPTKGQLNIVGISTQGKSGKNNARSNVALMLQFPETQFVAENVFNEIAFAPKNQSKSPQEVHQIVQDCMAKAGLEYQKFAARNPFKLSGGEKRRVALAGILATGAPIIALDEPCAGLDRACHAEILQLLQTLHKEGKTIIMVTHNIEDARLLADKTLRITNGHFVNL